MKVGIGTMLTASRQYGSKSMALSQKGAEIIEAEACPDYIHMLVSVPPFLCIAPFMVYLKGKSSLMIFDRHANLK